LEDQERINICLVLCDRATSRLMSFSSSPPLSARSSSPPSPATALPAPSPQWGVESLELLTDYFELEDPTTTAPAQCEKWLSGEFSAGDVYADDDYAAGDGLSRLEGLPEAAKKAKVVGVLDRVDRDATTGRLTIVDYKTGKAPQVAKYPPSTQARILDDKFFQLRVYAMLMQRTTGAMPDELRLLFLGSGDDVRVKVGPDDLKRTQAEVLQVWAEVVDAVETKDFKCRDPVACPYCSGRWAAPWDNNNNSGSSGGASSGEAQGTSASASEQT
jgi:hypothetical protein